MNNRAFRCTSFILLGLMLSACYSRRQQQSDYFHYNESSGITSLDPAFAKNQATMWPVHQLFNTLVEIDDSLRIVPSIARSWTISEDKTEYIFHLRTDVYFHDDEAFPGGRGRRLTASDVAYSFYRIIDKKTASPGAWIFNGKVDTVQPFTALNDSTFRLRLLKPFHPILGILSMKYCSIVPKEAVEKYAGNFRRHPVGTGPFRFVAWEEGQALVLERNPDYFEKDEQGQRLPYLKGIYVSFYESKATEFLLFRQKQLDFINDIESSFKDEVLTKNGELRSQWENTIVLKTSPYLNVEYLGILTDTLHPKMKDSPLRWKKIRQAINYGFNRRKMILYLRNSMGTPAEAGFIPPGLPSFDSTAVKGYSYQPDKARQLLKEAGFPDGKGLQEIKLLTIPVYADMANFIARELKEIGIPIKVEVVQKSLLQTLTAQMHVPFFRGSWIADYPDAENFLSVFYSANPAPPNYTRFKHPEFDKLYIQAIGETRDSVRFALYRKADRLVMENAPVVPLWYDKVIHLVQPYVKNMKPNPLNLLELRKTSLDSRK
ncbi:MAG: ABC transporter substrate-binding protein [Chitinophagaceae bacterium]|nr:ABC transporter substrate-binding protein [Chitinophagaceae bacterium]